MIALKRGYPVEVRRTLYPERIPLTRIPTIKKKPYCIILGHIYFWPRMQPIKRIEGAL